MAALCDIVSFCTFGDKEEEMLRDQIVEKVHSSSIQECLLLEADLILDKAIQIANQLESAMANASEFAKCAELSVQRLHVRKKRSERT